MTENLKGAPIDDAVQIADAKSIHMVYHLLHHEGLFVGASSAMNVVAAKEVAMQMPKVIIIIFIFVISLCDLFISLWLAPLAPFDRVP